MCRPCHAKMILRKINEVNNVDENFKIGFLCHKYKFASRKMLIIICSSNRSSFLSRKLNPVHT